MSGRSRRWYWLGGAAVVVLLGVLGYSLASSWSARTHRSAGAAALAQRDFRRAAQEFEAAARAWPTDARLHLHAAQAARRAGDFDWAVDHLQRAAQVPELAEAVALERQLWRTQNGDLAQPAVLLDRALARPDAPETPLILEALIEGCLKVLTGLNNLGFSFKELAAFSELRWAQQAVDLWLTHQPAHGDQVQGLIWRGRLRDLADDHAAAVADLRRAVELDPDRFAPRWQLALSIGQEAPAEALAHYERLLPLAGDNRRLRLLVALGRHGVGRLDEARPLLDELVASNPWDLAAVLARGKLALDAETPADAENWLRQAEALAPASPEVQAALARALKLQGRAAEAARCETRFTQLQAAADKRRQAARARALELRQARGDD